jgi:putative transposase
MPHNARIDAAGTIHRVMERWIDRSVVFRNNSDRDDLLRCLSTIVRETHTLCHARALMPNHVHLLLSSGQVSIPQVMRRLLTLMPSPTTGVPCPHANCSLGLIPFS